jgi:chromate transporter
MSDPAPLPPYPARLREVAGVFLRLGFISFGGPAAALALIEDEVVHRRRWLDRGHFLDMVATVNFIPGPNSTELAIHLGLLRAGFAGLLVAGICFVVPAVLIILPIAWFYVRFGSLPQVQHILYAINATIIAIVVVAMGRFARTGIRDSFSATVAIGAAAAGFACQYYFGHSPELLILAVAALAGVIRHYLPRKPPHLLLSLPAPWLGAAILDPTLHDNLWRMTLFFLKVGATLVGSGYVLVSYLQTGLVDQLHWMTPQQLLDTIAVGQVTPGPLLTSATFAGYLLGHQTFHGGLTGGIAGALLATGAIFAPAFVFIALLGPLLPKLRKNPLAREALDGMNAAVVALILVVTVRLGIDALHGWPAVALFAFSIALLWRWNVNATWIILGAAILGLIGGRFA